MALSWLTHFVLMTLSVLSQHWIIIWLLIWFQMASFVHGAQAETPVFWSRIHNNISRGICKFFSLDLSAECLFEKDVLFTLNVQHDCKNEQCATTGTIKGHLLGHPGYSAISCSGSRQKTKYHSLCSNLRAVGYRNLSTCT